jgi:hypothetical protein
MINKIDGVQANGNSGFKEPRLYSLIGDSKPRGLLKMRNAKPPTRVLNNAK